MRYLLFSYLLLCSNLLFAQEFQPDFPTITLQGNEKAEHLAKDRIVAINKIMDLYLGPKATFDLKWGEKKLTQFFINYNYTNEYELEEDMYIKMTAGNPSDPNSSYYDNVEFIYKVPNKQIYSGFTGKFLEKCNFNFDTKEMALRFCAYIRDIKSLMHAKSLTGLKLTKIKNLNRYFNTKDVDRIALTEKRLKAINELFKYEYEEDRHEFSLDGNNIRLKGHLCKQTITKMWRASYLSKPNNEYPFQVHLTVDKLGTLNCPKVGEKEMIFKFTNEEIAQLFLIYISDVQKIFFDYKLDVNALTPIKPIPSHIKKRDELAPVSMDAYASHPQLKYLGASVDHPELVKLANSKKITYFSDYNARKGFYFEVDENYGIVKAVHFALRRAKGKTVTKKKSKPYNGTLPNAISGVEIEEKYDSPFYYKIYKLDNRALRVFGTKNYETTLDLALAERQNSNKDFLIKSRADLKRYADPKGKDIWKLVDIYYDEILAKHIYNEYVKKYSLKRKKWNERDELHLSKSSYKLQYAGLFFDYIVKRSARSDQEYLRERLPISIDNLKFDLGTFLPQVFALPEFVEARYGDETTGKKYGKSITYKVIQLKFKTEFGDRYIIIKKYAKDPGATFSSMAFRNRDHSGYIHTKLGPLTLGNNPWRIHNESIVKVDAKTKEKYISTASRLFKNIVDDFESLKLNPNKFESNDKRDISFLADKIFEGEQMSMFLNYKNGSDHIQINLPEKIKDGFILTLINKKDFGSFEVTPVGLENESLFGKGLLIKRHQEIVGFIKYDWFNDDLWTLRIFSFKEEAFRGNLAKLIQQGQKDAFASWKGEKAKSNYIIPQADYASIKQIDKWGLSYFAFFQLLPRYLLEEALANVSNKKGLGIEGRVEESFVQPENDNRFLKYYYKGDTYLVSLSESKRGGSILSVSMDSSDDFKIMTEDNFSEMTASKMLSTLVKQYQKETSSEQVWTVSGDKDFAKDQQTSGKAETYILILVYEERYGQPSAGFSIKNKGKNQTLDVRNKDVMDFPEGLKGLFVKGTIPARVNEFRCYGGYLGLRLEGEVHAILLKEK